MIVSAYVAAATTIVRGLPEQTAHHFLICRLQPLTERRRFVLSGQVETGRRIATAKIEAVNEVADTEAVFICVLMLLFGMNFSGNTKSRPTPDCSSGAGRLGEGLLLAMGSYKLDMFLYDAEQIQLNIAFL